MPEYIVQRLEDILKEKNINLSSAKILIIGVTYKKDIKDLRKSPALDILEILQKHKASVSYYDPLIPYLKFNHFNLRSIRLDRTINKFHCVVIATDHTSMDYKLILKNSQNIFDTRNVYKNITDKKIYKL
jgi:UDP-N-acetyl-D-glucosamine dehydrogenase